MKSVELIRLEDTSEGTFGILKVNKKVLCFTLEPPSWINITSLSCIPVKQYICKRSEPEHIGETFEVTHVPLRTDIFFHIGNIVNDTKGCILLGMSKGLLKGTPAILDSGEAFREFMLNLVGEDEVRLTIKECY